MNLDTSNYHVTQHLIEKYYTHILGDSYRDKATTTGHKYRKSSSLKNRNGHSFYEKWPRNEKDTGYGVDDDGLNGDRFDDVQKLDQKLEEKYYNSFDNSGSTRIEEFDKNSNFHNKTLEEDVKFIPKCKSFLHSIFAGDYEKNLFIERIFSEKQHAMSYEEWKAAGLRLDGLTNKTQWKQKPESNLYDYKLIQNLTHKLREVRNERNYQQLLYLIRTNWVRNLGNMGNVNLYRQSHVGTKYIIDDYLTESKLCIEELVANSQLDDSYLLGILQQTRRNIGRTALVLSGGGTFGIFHIGIMATLIELDLLPRVISGSSAGAIVASIISVHYKEEIPELLERTLETEFNIFNDYTKKSTSENLLIKISRYLKNGTWFDNKHLMRTMIGFLGDLTFREAYNRTGKILNITVSPATMFEQPCLLNNLTAPNVLIWSAVCASCSLPGIFPSTSLYEKDPKTGEKREWNGSGSVKFVDGSVDNDMPITRLSEMFNVDHIIACQVNIHVFPFLKLALSCVGGDIQDEFSARFKQNLGSVYSILSNELIHALELGSELGLAKNVLMKARSILSQRYSGDITILPDLKMVLRFKELLSNPSKEVLLREITNAARATWPKVSIIQNHCGQELALDKAISFLKGKIIVSSAIRNPLQFSEVPVGLIKPNQQKPETNNGENHLTTVLDDNLMEAESMNSLLLLRENTRHYRRSTSGKFMSTLTRSPGGRRHRLRSDFSVRSRNASHSFSASSSTARLNFLPHKYANSKPHFSKKEQARKLAVPRDSKLVSRKMIPGADSAPTTRHADSMFLPSPSSAKLSNAHTLDYGMLIGSIGKSSRSFRNRHGSDNSSIEVDSSPAEAENDHENEDDGNDIIDGSNHSEIKQKEDVDSIIGSKSDLHTKFQKSCDEEKMAKSGSAASMEYTPDSGSDELGNSNKKKELYNSEHPADQSYQRRNSNTSVRRRTSLTPIKKMYPGGDKNKKKA